MTAKPAKQGQRKAQRGKAASPRTLAIRRKQDEAVRLRSRGWTFQAIADHLGYENPGSAYRAVQSVLSRVESESAEELRALQDDQIRQAYAVVIPMLSESELPEIPADWDREFADMVADQILGDRENRLKAVDRLVRLQDRQAKLHGLDAPARQDITSDGGSISVVFNEALAPKKEEK